MGLMMWMLAYAMDLAFQGDFYAAKKFLALVAAALWNSQCWMDTGKSPIAQLLIEKLQSTTASFDKEGGNCFPEKKASFSKASKVRERTKGFVMQKENGGMARVDAVPVLHDGLFSNENRVPIN